MVSTNDQDLRYSSCAFHPDGLILGTGTQHGLFKIWDIREQKNVASIKEHGDALNSISFSENGYLAATGSQDGTVKIWDLRKLACTKSLEIGQPVSSVNYDFSGVYLGIAAGKQVQVKVVKGWEDSVVRNHFFFACSAFLKSLFYFR